MENKTITFLSRDNDVVFFRFNIDITNGFVQILSDEYNHPVT